MYFIPDKCNGQNTAFKDISSSRTQTSESFPRTDGEWWFTKKKRKPWCVFTTGTCVFVLLQYIDE